MPSSGLTILDTCGVRKESVDPAAAQRAGRLERHDCWLQPACSLFDEETAAVRMEVALGRVHPDKIKVGRGPASFHGKDHQEEVYGSFP